jgi:hypothetical protein
MLIAQVLVLAIAAPILVYAASAAVYLVLESRHS